MKRDVSRLWEMYEQGIAYQNALGLPEQIKENIDFFEGRQWGNTKDLKVSKDYPRPVLNITKMICRNKKAAVLSAPVKLSFRGNRGSDGAELGDFLEYLQRDLRQDDMDNEATEDGTKKGTYIYHYYWDCRANGVYGAYEGAVRCEIIDERKVFFANPKERDEQKQKWILIATREEVEAVKALAAPEVNKALIVPDDAENADDVEQEGSKLCTVLTRYFRQNGEVYFERAVKGTMLHKPRSICPEHNEIDIEDDEGNEGLPEKPNKRNENENAHATLYPIAVGNWERREDSIYGLSEVEDIIPNQKAINRAEAIKILIGQAQSSSKIIAKEGALQGQKITNSPLQVIMDHCKGSQGFYTLPPATTSPILQTITDQLMANTRTVTGSTEVLSGEVISSNMSGAAIAQLQSQAQKPIQELQRRFYRTREKTGKILVQFAKLFYSSKEYSVYNPKTKQQEQRTFNGDQYREEEFDVTCEAGGGSVFSDSMTINMLYDLLKLQIIDAKMFLTYFPNNILPNKSEIIAGIEEREQGEIAQLQAAAVKQQAENQQMQEQIKQLTTVIQKQQQTVDKTASVIKEKRSLEELLAALQTEYTDKIQQANAALQQSAAQNAEVTNDAAYMAAQLAGIGNNAG